MSQPALEEQFEPGAGDTVEAARARSSWELFRHRFRQDKAAMAGAVILAILVVLALAAPLFARLTGHGPNELFPDEMLTPDIGLPKGPNADFWFGGDSVGRDVFVRTLYGARTSLTVALVATGLAALLGISLGMIAGYRGGKTDTFISRLIDIVLSMPVLLLAIGLASVCSISANGCLGGALQPGLTLVVGIIALFTWPNMARLVRGQALTLREKEFVEAARSLGARPPHHVQGAAPQPAGADRRLRDPADPGQHPVRGGAVVPGRRGAPVDAVLGTDAVRRRRRVDLHRGLVDDAVPRPVPARHHPVVQPRG